MLVSEYNSLGDGRYYDVETQSSFDFDHATGKASAVQSFVLESQQEDLVYVHPSRRHECYYRLSEHPALTTAI